MHDDIFQKDRENDNDDNRGCPDEDKCDLFDMVSREPIFTEIPCGTGSQRQERSPQGQCDKEQEHKTRENQVGASFQQGVFCCSG